MTTSAIITWFDDTGMANKMEDADKHGDSKTIFRIVKLVIGLMTVTSSRSPSIDIHDNMILDHKRLTSV